MCASHPSRLPPIRALRGCGIDGLAKMLLQASIFASWYNKHKIRAITTFFTEGTVVI